MNASPRAVPPVAGSYAYCERLARRAAGNFYPAFRILPRPQRRSMCALYAFMRVADDLADAPGPPDVKRLALAGYRDDLARALAGDPSRPLHPALCHAVREHRIPPEYLAAVLDGVTMDLEPIPFETFADLYRYCYHVASAVGLACIHVWGFRDPAAQRYAEKAGIAFQLTNILRDLGEDGANGRIYLPRDELTRFGYSPEQLRRGERGDAFRALMRFQAGRAHAFYDDARPLLPLLSPEGRAIYLVMERTYRGLLRAIERSDFDVFGRRVRLSKWRKLSFLLRSVPVRWGWA